MADLSLAAARTKDFSKEEIEQILERAAVLGLQMRVNPHSFTHVPISLLPSPVPEAEFQRAIAAMPLFNRLVDAIARDREWLHAHLEGLDEFTSRLVQVSKALGEPRQKVFLGIHRSDYMLDANQRKLKQVEINTISSSFGGIASTLQTLHSYLLEKFADRFPGFSASRLPSNLALRGIVDALFRAHSLQGSGGSVLMVINSGERNLFDQQQIELRLWKRYKVHLIRATLAEVSCNFTVDGETGLGRYSGCPVTVVYFRAGYGPGDYTDERDWAARLALETSSAVKCPCIDYHLAGVKKVQQLLCIPENLQRFVHSEEDRQQLREFFTDIYGLEQPLDPGLLATVRMSPSSWVLKPMREGGGNNLYDTELADAFADYEHHPDRLKGFILMRKIVPTPFKVIMLRDGNARESFGLWELGTFGTFISDGEKEILNSAPGHLLRTKSIESNEGGVAAGFAVVDTPYLV